MEKQKNKKKPKKNQKNQTKTKKNQKNLELPISATFDLELAKIGTSASRNNK